MKTILVSLAAAILWVTAPFVRAAESPPLEVELLQHAQELFDAVATGNPEPWKKYFADDCIFFDEKGRNLTKAEIVAKAWKVASFFAIPTRARSMP